MRNGTNNTIHELLRTRAEHAPEAEAIHTLGRTALTYRALLSQVDRVVRSLNARGIHPGDRVAIVLPNGPEMAVAFLGVTAGAICAPLNPAYSRSEFEFYLSDLNPRGLIVQSGMNCAVNAVAEKRGIPIIELVVKPEAAAGTFDLSDNEHPLDSQFGFPQANDSALILHTSGTTSRPKMVPLTHANLLASARNIAATLQLSEADRCLNVMPLFHIHGLVGALLSSVMAGAGVVCASGFSIELFFHLLDAFRPTWYTAVPTIHHAVLARAQAEPGLKNRSLRFIRSSSSALPARVMQGLEETFKVPVIESYGMTEAAHQMASNPLPPGLRKVGSVGVAAGPAVSIMGEAGNLSAAGQIGEIVIRGANVTPGYLNTESNTERSARDWFRTGDQGYLDKDGYLFITGRLKEIINRGGEKISPREVDDVILQHPSVAEAICFAIPHETLGEDIAAVVVRRQDAAVTEEELRRFVAAQLVEFKIPRRFLFVDEIPKSATGKPQRIGLAKKLDALLSEQRIHEFLAPRTPVEKTLVAIWSEVLGAGQIGIQDNFFNLGGDSIRATQVISRARQALNAELSIVNFFETPTIAGLAKCIEKPCPTEPSLQASTIQPIPRNEKQPLSFAQQRLWFLNQLERANAVYNRPLAVRLTGKLQVQVVERCLNEIVRRHEVLRTNFSDNGAGAPVQVIAPNISVKLPLIDLSHLPRAEREAQALRQATRESQQPFDLVLDPLFRACLYRLDAQDHLLLVVTHHIVFDGWSDGVLLGEIGKIYEAIIDGKPAPLADLPVQYADYAAWQRNHVAGKVFEKDLSYWKQQLNAAIPPLNLPTDRPRPAVLTYRGARQRFALPAQLSSRLKDLSRNERVTLSMTLLAGFKTLLYRYTGQEDILVGVPTAGRDRVETEQLLGVFINTLVLRTDLSGEPSFRDLLHRIREVALDAYTHQDLPFEKLIDALQPDRDLSRNPLFDVMFQLRNMPQQDVALPGLKSACVKLDIGVANFDLTLEVVDEVDGLECLFEYSTDLFDAATIHRMAGHFRILLEAIVANPEQRISELPLLTETEKHQLLVEWNNTKREYQRDKCVHELFETQASYTPEATAVVYEDQHLTYRELNNRSNQLARYLQKLGVSSGVRVGISVERSVEMAVGLLGIMKAGGVYVPLDPSHPADRLAFILNDTRASVLLTQERLQQIKRTAIDDNDGAGPRGDSNVELVCLDSDWIHISKESQEKLQTEAMTDDLAYVIHTSGSTGQPKGVMVSHQALVAHALSAVEHYQLGSSDKVLQFASLSFDVAAEEIFPAWLSGASVVLLPERAPVIADFVNYLIKGGITVANLPSSYWHQWVDELDRLRTKLPSSLRLLIVGNEKISFDHFNRWHRAVGSQVRWLNAYGPTEATITATLYEASRGDEEYRDLRSVPIGRPMTNRHTYILDRHLQLLPIGVTGEIYIGGPALAVGYLNDSELTAEKFIASPFCTDPSARLYRTGDLGRYLPDGNIEFLGRIDNQVKIRGFRIELGEVEAVLGRHSAVRNAVVLAPEDSSGNRRLVAYVVAGPDTSTNELRSFLREKVPEYMVPSAFIFLDTFPLTPNGKIDRKALPIPEHSHPALQASYIAPRTATEEMLAGIWAEVLKVDKVGIRDNFFELGGHSLLAVQLTTMIHRKVKAPIRVADVFEAPTVEQFALLLQVAPESTRSSLVALNRQGSRRPFFWVHGEASDAHLPRYLGLDQPVYGLRHQSEDGQPALYTTVEDIAAHYLEEIRSVQPQGPYLLGGNCFGGLVTLEMAKRLRAQGERTDLVVLLNPSKRALDWQNTSPQNATPTLLSYLHHHRHALALLRPYEKWRSLLAAMKVKAKETALNAFTPIEKMVQKIAWQICILLGVPIPPTLRSPYILEIYLKAIRRYTPQPHQESLVVYVTDDYPHKLRLKWRGQSGGNLTVHETPGNHESVLEEPNVGFWARKLKSCLDARLIRQSDMDGQTLLGEFENQREERSFWESVGAGPL